MPFHPVRLTRQSRAQPQPACTLQTGFWFEQVSDIEPIFNRALAVVVRGALDADVLARAIAFLVERHEVLRTTFREIGGVLHQVIAEPAAAALDVHEVRGGLDAARELAREHMRVRFDLTTQPPFRPRLYRLGPDEHVLSLVLHHIAYDIWSLVLLRDELWIAYAALARGEAPPIAPRPFDYVDFAAWHNAELPALREDLAHWRAWLGDGVPVLQLPTDRPRSADAGYRAAHRDFEIPSEAARAIVELAQRHGASAWMAYLAVLEIMLARETGQTEFGVGTMVSVLSRAQREGMFGPFLNVIPLRASLSGAPSFLEMLTRVRATALEAWSQRCMPWLWLCELAGPTAPGVTPHFQVLFVCDELPDTKHPVPFEIAPLDVHTGGAENDLLLSVYLHAGGARCTLESKAALFEPATINRLVAAYVETVVAVVADPGRALALGDRG